MLWFCSAVAEIEGVGGVVCWWINGGEEFCAVVDGCCWACATVGFKVVELIAVEDVGGGVVADVDGCAWVVVSAVYEFYEFADLAYNATFLVVYRASCVSHKNKECFCLVVCVSYASVAHVWWVDGEGLSWLVRAFEDVPFECLGVAVSE